MEAFSIHGETSYRCRKDTFQLPVQQAFAHETVKASPPQVMQCTLPLLGHQPANPPGLRASAQCNGELTSDP